MKKVYSILQGCGSGSRLDPDSIRSVDPDSYSESGSGSVFGIRIREGKNDPENRKNKIFHVVKCMIFSFES